MHMNRNKKNSGGNVCMSEKYRTRIWSNEVYNERGTSNVRNSIFICNFGGEFHVCESNISVCVEYNEPYCGIKVGRRRGEDSMDKPVSYTSYQHGITVIYERVM